MKGTCSSCGKTHYDADMSSKCDECLMAEARGTYIVTMFDPNPNDDEDCPLCCQPLNNGKMHGSWCK